MGLPCPGRPFRETAGGRSGSGSAARIASGSTGGLARSARTLRHQLPRLWLDVPGGRMLMRPYSRHAGRRRARREVEVAYVLGGQIAAARPGELDPSPPHPRRPSRPHRSPLAACESASSTQCLTPDSPADTAVLGVQAGTPPARPTRPLKGAGAGARIRRKAVSDALPSPIHAPTSSGPRRSATLASWQEPAGRSPHRAGRRGSPA
jgi:hypothetical protein